MAIEVATYIGDLQPLNPPSTDPRSQGDDHLRLIKAVLQNSFPSLEKATYFGTVLIKSANYTVVSTDQNSVVQVDTTSGVVTLTLPTLGAGDAGWKIDVVKTNKGANAMFIAPATGTLNSGGYTGLAQARRSIQGVKSTVSWDGTNWFVTRPNPLPPGSLIPCQGANLPPGYEWPNGQTLSSVATNYPELNAEIGTGVLLDKRGRVGVTLDNLGGSAANRLNGGQITGTAVGNSGGHDTYTILTANLPPYTPAGSVSTSSSSSSTGLTAGAGPVNIGGSGSGGTVTGISISSSSTFTGSAQGGSSTAFGLLQPSIMVSEILLAE